MREVTIHGRAEQEAGTHVLHVPAFRWQVCHQRTGLDQEQHRLDMARPVCLDHGRLAPRILRVHLGAA